MGSAGYALCKGRGNPCSPEFSSARHFHRGLGGAAQLCSKSLRFGLLHAACLFVIAAGSSQAFEHGQAQAGEQMLGGSRQALERFPRRLITAAPDTAVLVLVEIGLRVGGRWKFR